MFTTARVRLTDVPYRLDKDYEYYIPDVMRGVETPYGSHPSDGSAVPGSLVIVPFGAGNRRMLGVVTAVTETSELPAEKLKPITELRPERFNLTDEQLGLCDFLCLHTFCSFGDAISAVLPSAVLRGLDRAMTPANIKYSESVSLVISDEEADSLIPTLRGTHQPDIIRALLGAGGSIDCDELLDGLGIRRNVMKPLIDREIIAITRTESYRDPYAERIHTPPPDDNILTPEQQSAADTLAALADSGDSRAALLYGVTGSGKTRVIKAAIDHVLLSGRQAVVLVPEIALTPQTVGLFRSFYGNRIAVIHSQLSAGERFDAWRRIKNGEVDVCIGTRSAVFAPFERLGLIVIDEEQEHTYKSDMSPKYHARTVASWRCGRNKALMLLSSATPSVESFSKAEQGRYTLIRLNERYGDAVLPEGVIVDMRGETLRPGDVPISERLRDEIAVRLERGEQTILFVNRRGYNNFVSCPKCGEVVMCAHCSVSMTYHMSHSPYENGYLMCHYCGSTAPMPDACPKCGFSPVSRNGYGTQKAEEQIKALFPSANVLRVDADTTRGKFAHEAIFEKFRNGGADILIGTQMVTKGHDFPNVTLVGVLNADSLLYVGDYRANERAFSLITQVVGRAGRADKPGMALVQTYSPEHSIIKLAAAQDYIGMYRGENMLRKALVFPPYGDIVTLTLSGDDENGLNVASKLISDEIGKLLGEKYADAWIVVFGPFEAPVYKLNGVYRMRYVLKCRLNVRTREFIREILSAMPSAAAKRITLSADTNPNEL